MAYRVSLTNGKFNHFNTKSEAVRWAIKAERAPNNVSAAILSRDFGVKFKRISAALSRSVGLSNPVKKRRTAAQIRATKKLVAFNKARGRLNKKRAAPKRKATKRRTPAQIRATKKLIALNKRRGSTRKTAKRNPPKRKTISKSASRWVIKGLYNSSRLGIDIGITYFTGRSFSVTKTMRATYPTRNVAQSVLKTIKGQVPLQIHSVKVAKA